MAPFLKYSEFITKIRVFNLVKDLKFSGATGGTQDRLQHSSDHIPACRIETIRAELADQSLEVRRAVGQNTFTFLALSPLRGNFPTQAKAIE